MAIWSDFYAQIASYIVKKQEYFTALFSTNHQ